MTPASITSCSSQANHSIIATSQTNEKGGLINGGIASEIVTVENQKGIELPIENHKNLEFTENHSLSQQSNTSHTQRQDTYMDELLVRFKQNRFEQNSSAAPISSNNPSLETIEEKSHGFSESLLKVNSNKQIVNAKLSLANSFAQNDHPENLSLNQITNAHQLENIQTNTLAQAEQLKPSISSEKAFIDTSSRTKHKRRMHKRKTSQNPNQVSNKLLTKPKLTSTSLGALPNTIHSENKFAYENNTMAHANRLAVALPSNANSKAHLSELTPEVLLDDISHPEIQNDHNDNNQNPALTEENSLPMQRPPIPPKPKSLQNRIEPAPADTNKQAVSKQANRSTVISPSNDNINANAGIYHSQSAFNVSPGYKTDAQSQNNIQLIPNEMGTQAQAFRNPQLATSPSLKQSTSSSIAGKLKKQIFSKTFKPFLKVFNLIFKQKNTNRPTDKIHEQQKIDNLKASNLFKKEFYSLATESTLSKLRSDLKSAKTTEEEKLKLENFANDQLRNLNNSLSFFINDKKVDNKEKIFPTMLSTYIHINFYNKKDAKFEFSLSNQNIKKFDTVTKHILKNARETTDTTFKNVLVHSYLYVFAYILGKAEAFEKNTLKREIINTNTTIPAETS